MVVMKVTVKANKTVSADFRQMEVEWPEGLGEPAPGQFVMVRKGEGTDPLWRRPFGVHDFRRRRGSACVHLLYQIVGPTTARMAEIRRGEGLELLGPFGRGYSIDSRERWLVAGGRGIAPLFYLARSLKRGRIPGRVFNGGCTAAHLLKTAEMEKLGFKTLEATEDGSLGRKGLVTEILEKSLKRLSSARCRRIVIAACGPEGMLRSVSRLARRFHTSAELSLDTLMACGQGICQGCSVETVSGRSLTCCDGPVFSREELKW